MKRDRVIGIRVSDEEYAALMAASGSSSVPKFMREAGLEAAYGHVQVEIEYLGMEACTMDDLNRHGKDGWRPAWPGLLWRVKQCV